LILANSGRRSEKSAAERLHFNRGIFAYRFAFLALRDALRALAAAGHVSMQDVQETTCLGDIQTERFSLALIYDLLLSLPERASPASLREAYPEAFAAAARGCFGTTDPG